MGIARTIFIKQNSYFYERLCSSTMSDLCKSDGAGVGENPDVDQHIGQQGQHQAPHEPAQSFF